MRKLKGVDARGLVVAVVVAAIAVGGWALWHRGGAAEGERPSDGTGAVSFEGTYVPGAPHAATPSSPAPHPVAPAPPPRPRPPAPPHAPSEARLMSELRALKDRDPARAIELAREGNRRFPDSPEAPERTSILIHALASRGEGSAARGEAEGMVNHYPDSDWVRDVERFTGAHRHRNLRLDDAGVLEYQQN